MNEQDKYASDQSRTKVSLVIPCSLRDDLEAQARREMTTVAALLRRGALKVVAEDFSDVGEKQAQRPA